MKRPFCFLGATALVFSAFSLYCSVSLLIFLFICISAVLFLYFIILKKRALLTFGTLITYLCLIAVTVSCIFSILFVYTPTAKLAGSVAEFEGVVTNKPEKHGIIYSYNLKGSHSLLEGEFKCSVVTNKRLFEMGDSVRLSLECEPLDKEYKNNDLANGRFVSAKIDDVISVSRKASLFYTTLGNLQKYIKNRILATDRNDIGGVMIALLSGDRSYISDSFYGKTKVCGVTHIMVVSGLHVSILSGVLLNFFQKIKLRRRIASFAVFLALMLLIAVCDFHLSAIRSVIMSVIILSGSLFFRKADSLNSLGLAVWIMVTVNPFIAGSVSFLLSVMATFGVVFLSPMISFLTEKLRLKGIFALPFNYIIDSVVVSLSATICLIPLLVEYFGSVTLLSPLVTALIGFMVGVVITLTVLGVSVSAIPYVKIISVPILYVAGLCTGYINAVIDFFGNMNFTILPIDHAWSFVSALLSAAFIFAVWLLYKKKLKERKNEDAAKREDSEKLA